MRKYLIILIVAILAIIVLVAWNKDDGRLEPQKLILSQEDAIQAAINTYPELGSYQATSLPPRRIETEKNEDGWYLGFITEGSGLQSILDARCFYVSEQTGVKPTGDFRRSGDELVQRISLKTCAPTLTSPSQSTVLPYGPVTLALSEKAQFPGLTIRPTAVTEDSRCPTSVQCIQAGTVRVRTEIVSAMGTSTQTIALGSEVTTEAERVRLTAVEPQPQTPGGIAAGQYRFTYIVERRAPATIDPPAQPVGQGACYKGGCSGQICSDQKNVVSTCEFREEYACYQTATCERQANGQCGWTVTPQLTQCLSRAKQPN
jgi:hypothetical protein